MTIDGKGSISIERLLCILGQKQINRRPGGRVRVLGGPVNIELEHHSSRPRYIGFLRAAIDSESPD